MTTFHYGVGTSKSKTLFKLPFRYRNKKKLIGLDVIHDSLQSQHILPSNLLLSSLEKKTGKNFQSYTSEVTQTPDNGQLIKLRREIQKVKLIEVIHISIQHGKLKRFESQLLIPNAYANHINTQIEKQKTIHQFFPTPSLQNMLVITPKPSLRGTLIDYSVA